MDMRAKLMKAGFRVELGQPNISLEEKKKVSNFVLDPNKNYYYRVEQQGTEGISSGFVFLLPKEAQLVKKITDKSSWSNAYTDYWSGRFFIDIENPLEELPFH